VSKVAVLCDFCYNLFHQVTCNHCRHLVNPPEELYKPRPALSPWPEYGPAKSYPWSRVGCNGHYLIKPDRWNNAHQYQADTRQYPRWIIGPRPDHGLKLEGYIRSETLSLDGARVEKCICPVCVHPAKDVIEERIRSGEPLEQILEYHGILCCHRPEYIGDRQWFGHPPQLALAYHILHCIGVVWKESKAHFTTECIYCRILEKNAQNLKTWKKRDALWKWINTWMKTDGPAPRPRDFTIKNDHFHSGVKIHPPMQTAPVDWFDEWQKKERKAGKDSSTPYSRFHHSTKCNGWPKRLSDNEWSDLLGKVNTRFTEKELDDIVLGEQPLPDSRFEPKDPNPEKEECFFYESHHAAGLTHAPLRTPIKYRPISLDEIRERNAIKKREYSANIYRVYTKNSKKRESINPDYHKDNAIRKMHRTYHGYRSFTPKRIPPNYLIWRSWPMRRYLSGKVTEDPRASSSTKKPPRADKGEKINGFDRPLYSIEGIYERSKKKNLIRSKPIKEDDDEEHEIEEADNPGGIPTRTIRHQISHE
jgi:hypothetical protein